MKKVCLAFIMIVLISLAGCRQEAKPAFETDPETGMPVLSEERRVQIEEAYGKSLTYGNNGVIYYGTYSGFDVFIRFTGLEAADSQEIAGELFHCSTGFRLDAFKDGSRHSLLEVYRENLISKEEISKIAKVHRFFYSKFYN